MISTMLCCILCLPRSLVKKIKKESHVEDFAIVNEENKGKAQ